MSDGNGLAEAMLGLPRFLARRLRPSVGPLDEPLTEGRPEPLSGVPRSGITGLYSGHEDRYLRAGRHVQRG